MAQISVNNEQLTVNNAVSNYTEYVNAVNEAKLHDYRYFTLNAPTISDEQYDRLYFAIQDYETAHPDETLADSPTQSAHGEVKNGHKQIRRRTEMLSTEKAQTIEKVQKWMKKTTKKLATVPGASATGLYTVEWKYDGISLSLVYIDGQLTEASYGKGMEGNDCLLHCLKVASIPNTIPASGRVEVRGEMVVPFANLKKTGYKNCRSAASGIMADTASTLTECLEFHPYWASGLTAEADDDLSNNIGVISALQGNLGFLYDGKDSLNHALLMAGIDRQDITLQTIEQIIAVAEQMRPTLSFPTDGLVIKVADRDTWDSLGRNDHHPHYAIAYKFAAATAETTVTRIEITTGATGKRTPVAYFEPIVINGSTYQKASIGSEKKLADLGIEVGSHVIVSLRNDVIPHIDSVIVAENNQSEQDMRYVAPEIQPVVSTPEPICAPVIVSEPHYSPIPLTASCSAQPKRHYRMVGEGNHAPSPSNGREEATAEDKVSPIAYALAALTIIAAGVLLFAGLGAAVFFLPLLAGAFK